MAPFLSDPYELPAVLALLGLLTGLLASMRGRNAPVHRRRPLRWAYALAGSLALVLGLGLGVQQARSFWDATWDAEREQILLERPFPLGDVRIPSERIDYVSEVSAPERTLAGVQRVVRFEVRLQDGSGYRSAPFVAGDRLPATRRALAFANEGRLQRFLIGTRTPGY